MGIDSEDFYDFDGWRIRVWCAFDVGRGQFGAHSSITKDDGAEIPITHQAMWDGISMVAKGYALKAAKDHIRAHKV